VRDAIQQILDEPSSFEQGATRLKRALRLIAKRFEEKGSLKDGYFLMEYLIGKPTQAVQVEQAPHDEVLDRMTREELRAFGDRNELPPWARQELGLTEALALPPASSAADEKVADGSN